MKFRSKLPRRRHFSLKRKIVLVSVLMALVPLIFVSIYISLNMQSQMRTEFIKSAKAQTIQVDNALTMYFNGVKENVKLLAEDALVTKADSTITSYLNRTEETVPMTPSQNGGIESEIYNTYAHFANSHPSATYIYMATKNGGYIQYPEGSTYAHYNPAERPYYKAAVENPNKVTMTGAYYYKADDTVEISTVTTIKNNNGEIIGVQGLDVNLTGITEMIKSIRIGNTGFMMLVQNDGTILADPDDTKMNFKPISNLGIKELDNLKGISEQAFETSYKGKPYLINIYTAPNTGWKYIAFMEKADVFSSVVYLNKVILATAVLFTILVVIVAFLFAKRITEPLVLLEETAGTIAGGDLTPNWEVISKDEVGSLSNSIKLMLESLRTIVDKVRQGASSVSSASRDLSSNTEQNTRVSSQIAQAATELAQNSERQTENIQQISSIIEETTASVTQISTSVQTVSDFARSTAEDAQAGNQSMSTAMQQMNNIEISAQSMSGVLKGLNERSNSIGQIVQLISGIAGQTNLLALNAAIESARAGEHGRGFAVVAEEVRKLAEQSQQATIEISSLIQGMQKDSDQAVEAMTETIRSINDGTQIISSGAAAFQHIESSILQVSQQISEVASVAETLARGSKNMTASIKEIEYITEGVNAAGQEMAASTEEQSATLEEIAASAEALAHLSQDLLEGISHLKLQ